MSRRKLIAGNWKMHGTRDSVSTLLQALKQNTIDSHKVELVVLSPYVFLADVQQQLSSVSIAWGAQNVNENSNGAFTGEISADMLIAFGCTYVIVGHSERRQYYYESNDLVAKKFFHAQKSGLKTILCVGETEEQRAAGQTLVIIRQQLAAVLDLVDNLDVLHGAVIAYEPVWAIGTGKVATAEQAQHVHEAIRAQLRELNPLLADQLRIIYGGSVKVDNAAELFAQADIDGGLIGGASLKAQEFLEIANTCHN